MPASKPWTLTETIYLMDRQIEYPITPEQKSNMEVLLARINDFLEDLPPDVRPGGISSGYRPGRFNTAAGGAPRSGHLICRAVDLLDPKNLLDAYLDKHPELLVKHLLWREDPARTPGWTHLDTTVRKTHTFKV